ncbi:MAG: dihydrolipoamide acetyltransferase family protein [Psychroflexus sp.]|nr:dihydrolipoamide acetyltransferase family protein [Psychroflexus sp.]
MATVELKLPKMGESVAEATLTNWLKEVGDSIEQDEPVLEIATDKVDSEVPSEVDGVLKEKKFDVDDVIEVGQTIAIIETEGEEDGSDDDEIADDVDSHVEEAAEEAASLVAAAKEQVSTTEEFSESSRFYSPLVKNIAKEENISLEELESITGSGKEGRVTKDDVFAYLDNRQKTTTVDQSTSENAPASKAPQQPVAAPKGASKTEPAKVPIDVHPGDDVQELSRMGKLIASHMVHSIQTSAHVQSFIEVDVTPIFNWRKKVKDEFLQREGEKLTFTPIFMEAVVKAIKDFPLVNISLDGDKIIKHKHINLGMAAALPDNNLIVPVIRDADQLNLTGLAKRVNDLANRARHNKLKPDETQGGTYTVTNVGTFGSVMGTPIINQPQVGILALGAIRKVPAVVESDQGDFIGIRHKMFLSHSYDHRVVNGALGGQFVQRVAQYLESFDTSRTI